jgi:hypothetical protein
VILRVRETNTSYKSLENIMKIVALTEFEISGEIKKKTRLDSEIESR